MILMRMADQYRGRADCVESCGQQSQGIARSIQLTTGIEYQPRPIAMCDLDATSANLIGAPMDGQTQGHASLLCSRRSPSGATT